MFVRCQTDKGLLTHDVSDQRGEGVWYLRTSAVDTEGVWLLLIYYGGKGISETSLKHAVLLPTARLVLASNSPLDGITCHGMIR